MSENFAADTLKNTAASAAGLVLEKNYAAAEGAYEALSAKFPNDQNFLTNKLLCGLYAGKLDENALNTALELFESQRADGALMLFLARVYQTEDMNDAAVGILEEIRARDDSNITAAERLAVLYQERHEGDKLESLIKSVFPKFARDERVLCLAANYAQAFGNMRQAAFLYDRALRLNRPYVLHFSPFYDFLQTRRQYKKIIRYAKEALKTSPDDLFVKEALLLALINTERLKDAADLFADMDKNPDEMSDDILAFWAETLSHARKYDEAFDAAYRVSKNFRKYDDMYFFLSKMLYFMRETGMTDACAARAARWTADYPEDESIRYICAAVTDKTQTPTPSPMFARKVYDNMAEDFDYVLVSQLKYKGPEVAAKILREAKIPELKSKAVLDLGCGTGLAAETLKPYTQKFGMLTGVDVAPKMLDEARKKALYDRLVQDDIVSYLKTKDDDFDLISCLDVFVCFGDIQPVLAGVHRALKDGGHFIFSVSTHMSSEPYALLASGRYVHFVPYVASLLENQGFEIVTKQDDFLRTEMNKPVPSTVFLARKK